MNPRSLKALLLSGRHLNAAVGTNNPASVLVEIACTAVYPDANPKAWQWIVVGCVTLIVQSTTRRGCLAKV